MRVAARLVGVPLLAVAVVTAASALRAKSAPAAPPAPPAPAPGAPAAHVQPAPERRTIVGEWSLANGVFEFHRTGAANTFTDTVISQRPGVFCPKINDQNGQMVLHHRRGGVYTGTWAWFYVGSCRFAGYGSLTVTVWWGEHATFVANPPAGLPGSSHTFIINRTPS